MYSDNNKYSGNHKLSNIVCFIYPDDENYIKLYKLITNEMYTHSFILWDIIYTIRYTYHISSLRML